MWGLLLCTSLFLGLLYYLPQEILGDSFRQIDILSDLRKFDTLKYNFEANDLEDLANSSERIIQDDLLLPGEDSLQTDIAEVDNDRLDLALKSAQIPIDDYAEDQKALAYFYQALNQKNKLDRPIRIAVLGDSFIEGDIFTSPLRILLQNKFGGGGVGWMPLSSKISGFRTSIKHEFSGWKDNSILDGQSRGQILSGHYFTTTKDAWVSYRTNQETKKFDAVTLYYTSKSDQKLKVEYQGEAEMQVVLPASDNLQAYSCNLADETNFFKMTTTSSKDLSFYGLALERRSGLSLDNMSLRASSGSTILSVDKVLTHQFCLLRQYDLIILQYGLNVANKKQMNYNNYGKVLQSIVTHLRKLSPHSSILIMGVSDRANKSVGTMETMPAIYKLHDVQQRVAKETGVAFWSILKAMQYKGGIVSMAKRGEAAKDYTHLSHKGGGVLAELFFEALLADYSYYNESSI